MTRLSAYLLSTLLVATGSAALAQAPVPQQAPNMPAPKETIPEKIAPNDPSTTGATLSEKLEASDGVIKPPANMDPEITVPAPVPNPGTTPVIPPPGSPGGNTTVGPK